jgi:hypothetical protein
MSDAWGRAHAAESHAKALWLAYDPIDRGREAAEAKEAYAAAYLVAADAWEEAGEAFRAWELRGVAASEWESYTVRLFCGSCQGASSGCLACCGGLEQVDATCETIASELVSFLGRVEQHDRSNPMENVLTVATLEQVSGVGEVPSDAQFTLRIRNRHGRELAFTTLLVDEKLCPMLTEVNGFFRVRREARGRYAFVVTSDLPTRLTFQVKTSVGRRRHRLHRVIRGVRGV